MFLDCKTFNAARFHSSQPTSEDKVSQLQYVTLKGMQSKHSAEGLLWFFENYRHLLEATCHCSPTDTAAAALQPGFIQLSKK